MTAAVVELAGEVVDCDGHTWTEDRFTGRWDSPDYGLVDVTTEWLREFRLVTA